LLGTCVGLLGDEGDDLSKVVEHRWQVERVERHVYASSQLV
jgi:hypothetical protein